MPKGITSLLTCLTVTATVAGFSVASNAATVTYNSSAAFLAAGNSPSTSGLAIEAVSGSPLVSSAGYSTLIPAGWAISGVENFNVNITVPSLVFGFGMNVHEPIAFNGKLDGCNIAPNPCLQSTFQVKLFDGVTAIDTVTFSPPDDVLAFFGVTSTSYFNRLEIREIVGSNDNEFFGGFVTTASPVPLPAAAWLFGSALLGLVATARRRQAA